MSRNFASSLVQLSPRSGLDVNVYLALSQKPNRQAQKLETLKKYVEKHSSGWKKRLELAELLYATGQWSEAIAEYQQVIQKQPQLLSPQIQLGKILQLIGQEEEAIAVYQIALTLAKQEASIHHLKGLIASCQNCLNGAIDAFTAATNAAPTNPAHWLALGQTQIAMESPAAALASMEAILLLDPNDLTGLIYSHDLLLALDNPSKAERRLDHAVAIAAQDVQTLKRLIAHRCRQGKVCGDDGKQTKKLINGLLAQAACSPEVHHLLAQYYVLRGEPEKGLQITKDFAENNGGNPQAWYYYSLCLRDLGQLEAAATSILKAYRLSKDRCDREIYRALCQILPTVGKLKKTRSLMTEMLEKYPHCWSLWAIAGKVLVEHFQENERGCHYAQKSTDLQPLLADAWLAYGHILSLVDQPEAAITALTQAWQLLLPATQSPKVTAIGTLLGESYQKIGHEKVAQEWLQRASQATKD